VVKDGISLLCHVCLLFVVNLFYFVIFSRVCVCVFNVLCFAFHHHRVLYRQVDSPVAHLPTLFRSMVEVSMMTLVSYSLFTDSFPSSFGLIKFELRFRVDVLFLFCYFFKQF